MLTTGFVLLSLLLLTPLFQATPATTDDPGIPPVLWELIEFTEEGAEPVTITEPERYTVQFQAEGELAIGADCNSAGAGYAIEEGDLEISPIRSTLILCPDDSQAQPFLTLLEQTTNFAFDDEGMLILTGPDGSLTLRPSLTAVVWEWREFRGGDDSVVTPDNSQKYTLEFLPDNKLAIRADCNRAMGTFSADGTTLELTLGGMTRAMCPPDSLMDRYIRDLGDVRSHVFRDGKLYLALFADAGIMEFAATVPTTPAATPVAG